MDLDKSQNGSCVLCLALLCLLAGCDKIGKKIENYDMFGLEKADEAIQMQQKKIKAARDYQKNFSKDPAMDIDNAGILGN